MSEPKSSAQLFRNACREARLVLLVWFLALVWSVGYCYLFGYQHQPDDWVVQMGLASVRSPQDLHYYWGIPDWVFFGILAPWLLCSAFTVIFAKWIMTDDDLGQEAEEGTASHGH